MIKALTLRRNEEVIIYYAIDLAGDAVLQAMEHFECTNSTEFYTYLRFPEDIQMSDATIRRAEKAAKKELNRLTPKSLRVYCSISPRGKAHSMCVTLEKK